MSMMMNSRIVLSFVRKSQVKVGNTIFRRGYADGNPFEGLKSLLSQQGTKKATENAKATTKMRPDVSTSKKEFGGGYNKQRREGRTERDGNRVGNRESNRDGTNGTKYAKKDNANRKNNDGSGGGFRERGGKYGNGKNHGKRAASQPVQESPKEKLRNLFHSAMEGANDRDIDNAKRIVEEAVSMNKKGLAQVIRKGGDIKIENIVYGFVGLNLKEEGLMIVGHRAVKEDEVDILKALRDRNRNSANANVDPKLLIVKVVEREAAVKQYSDYLNEQVVEKLKLSNSTILAKQKRGKEEGGRSDLKLVQIGWNINMHDLLGQKKFEIETHLNKQNDVEIVIDDKEYLDMDNQFGKSGSGCEVTEEKMEIYKNRCKQLTDLETAMRNKTLNAVMEMLHEIEGLLESNIGAQKGFFESRLMIRVKAPAKNTQLSKAAKREQKQLEKQQRAERNRLRREEKERARTEQLRELAA
jgi:hypothetical protein